MKAKILNITRRAAEALWRPVCAVRGCKAKYRGAMLADPNRFYGCRRCGRCVCSGQTFAEWHATPAIPMADTDHWEDDYDLWDDAA